MKNKKRRLLMEIIGVIIAILCLITTKKDSISIHYFTAFGISGLIASFTGRLSAAYKPVKSKKPKSKKNLKDDVCYYGNYIFLTRGMLVSSFIIFFVFGRTDHWLLFILAIAFLIYSIIYSIRTYPKLMELKLEFEAK